MTTHWQLIIAVGAEASGVSAELWTDRGQVLQVEDLGWPGGGRRERGNDAHRGWGNE